MEGNQSRAVERATAICVVMVMASICVTALMFIGFLVGAFGPLSCAAVVTGKRSPRWAFLDRTIIRQRKTNDLYLDRLRIINTPWFGINLHRILSPDLDYDPHDHPWTFWSLVLRGSYTERLWLDKRHTMRQDTRFDNSGLYTEQRHHPRWSVHRMGREAAHKITSIAPGTVTLVFTGPRRGSWGFWTRNGFVDWEDYE